MYCTSEQYELYSEIYFLGEKKLVSHTPNPEIILKSYLVDYRFHSNCKAEEVESCVKCAFLFIIAVPKKNISRFSSSSSINEFYLIFIND